jgi:hypothetical protein
MSLHYWLAPDPSKVRASHTAYFIVTSPSLNRIITVSLTSKGGDNDNDLKNNYPLLSIYFGSSTVQDTLQALYLVLTNLQGIGIYPLSLEPKQTQRSHFLFQFLLPSTQVR